jgi:hypothetical protein
MDDYGGSAGGDAEGKEEKEFSLKKSIERSGLWLH